MSLHLPSPASAALAAHSRHTVRRLEIHEDCVMLVRRGMKTFSVGQRDTVARAGSLLVASRGTVADVTNQPDGRGLYEALVLAFPAELVREAMPPAGQRAPLRGSIAIDPDPQLRGAIERAHMSLSDADASPRLRWLRAAEVLELLLHSGLVFGLERLSVRDRVWRLLNSDPSHEWAVDEVAASLAMGQSTLRRHLSDQGETFSDLVRAVRLECGLMLLLSTARPVTNIAGDVGFQSPSRFSSAFKTRFGFLPSVLRGKSSAAAH
jgi:AraC-like DNA-binding protein